MFLSKLRIENLRSIKDEIIDLKPHMLFVGANDHGKTNILKIIESCLNLDFDENGALLNKNFYNDNKRYGSGASAVRCTFIFDDLPPGLRHTKQKLKWVAISMRFYSNSTVKLSFSDLKLKRHSNRHNKKAYKKFMDIKQNLNVRYIPTFRDLASHLDANSNQSIFYSLLSEYLNKAIKKSQGGTTTEYRAIRQIKLSVDDLLNSSFSEIREVTGKYLPSIFGSESFNLTFLKSSSEDGRDKALSKMIAKETHIQTPNNITHISELGSGIQQAVTIGLIEKSYISHTKSNILLFEEPESFLHPNAQREIYIKLAKLSKRPATQMIFTTHSSAILDSTQIDSIAVVRKAPLQVPYHERNTTVLQVSTGLTKASELIDRVELEKTFENSDVFFSELVVFVEGFSDELVLKEVLKKLAPDLVYRVSIVSCGGNSKFSVMTKFLENFQNKDSIKIRWVIVTDKDTLRRDAIKDLKEIPSGDSVNWESVVESSKKIIPQLPNGMINRNSASLWSKKINKETNKANIFVFDADIEFSIITEKSLGAAEKKIKQFHAKGESTLKVFSGVDKVAQLIGSRGPHGQWSLDRDNKSRWKKASLHRAIASDLTTAQYSDELHRLILFIRSKL